MKIAALIFFTTFILLISISGVYAACPSGMVSYWRFDENSGTTAYDSADSNNGVLINNPAWVSGKINSALNFNGINQYVSAPDNNNLDLTVFSLEAWFKLDSFPDKLFRGNVNDPPEVTGNGSTILAKGEDSSTDHDNYAIYIISDSVSNGNVIACEFENNSDYDYRIYYNINSAYLGKWTHVVCTLEGTNFKLYVDGTDVTSSSRLFGEKKILTTSLPTGVLPATGNSPLFIGAINEATKGLLAFFNGTIDEVTIYNRALTSAEVLDHYNNGLGKYLCLDTTPPTVSVNGAPAGWTNQLPQYASVGCQDTESGCDTSTYKFNVSNSNPGTCPTNYNSYNTGNPFPPPNRQTIIDYSWVCTAAKDMVGNTGFSAPTEFRIDKVPPQR